MTPQSVTVRFQIATKRRPAGERCRGGQALAIAADDLVTRLAERGPGVPAARRLIAAARPLL
jgi:hypothetical protein